MKNSKKRKLIVAICALFVAAHCYNSIREKHKLHHPAIVQPRLSSWQHLLHNGDEDSFLVLTGLNFATFRLVIGILSHDEPVFGKRGRPSSLNLEGKLGLLLFYLSSHCRTKHLCLLFGIVPSVADRYILEMLDKVIAALSKHPNSQICFPTLAEMAVYAAMIAVREPTVPDVMGFVDGCHFFCKCGESKIEQGKYYNGHVKDTTVNNIFLFGPDGIIRFACFNYPGSMHDGQVSYLLVREVINKIGPYKACVDQGFARSGELYDRFVGPISRKRLQKIARHLRPLLVARSHRYTSLRQAIEWGMRGLQGSFSRLTSRLSTYKHTRRNIIHSILLLHNLRTHHIGLNQIKTVFNPEYEQYIHMGNYDKIHRYFANVGDD